MNWKAVAIAILVFAAVFLLQAQVQNQQSQNQTNITKFSSDAEFREYLARASTSAYLPFYGVLRYAITEAVPAVKEATPTSMPAPTATPVPTPTTPPVTRYSQTNVQVFGIDEPDIVKTDGKRIYYSHYGYYPYRHYYRPNAEIKIINAFPPSNLSLLSEIDTAGNLLLINDTLIVLTYNKISAYDVSDPENPEKIWKITLNGSMVAARLYSGKIYVVVEKGVSPYVPLPIVIGYAKEPIIVRSTEIYHPPYQIQADSVYSVLVISPDGSVEDKVSFVGKQGRSVVYMSRNAIYITYPKIADYATLYPDFLSECDDIIPKEVIDRIKKVESYDISSQAKAIEYTMIINEYVNSLDKDEAIKVRSELSNRFEKYMKEHAREIEKTGIVKVKLSPLEVYASTEIPGRLLNQFSMDEYDGYLRVATTVGRWRSEANDVYVLDEKLNVVGSIKDLGLTERIYAVRFLGDRGYIVTFRQTDPFFVLDLSKPSNPELKGELKIPGYSSYLHPIDEHAILGIGMEGWRVKISLFDVSSAEKPVELDRYTLDEHWSDILTTHHAFLIDSEKKIFFLPAAKAGYIFSYKGNELKLVKAVAASNAKRAIYINDYLYVISEDKVVVIDENTWEKIDELELQ